MIWNFIAIPTKINNNTSNLQKKLKKEKIQQVLQNSDISPKVCKMMQNSTIIGYGAVQKLESQMVREFANLIII